MSMKPNPSPVKVGYLTLIHEDGSKETLTVSAITKLKVDPVQSDKTKIKIIADTSIEYSTAPPMPKRIYELSPLHVGLHLNYGLIHGRIDHISRIEVSDGRDNWSTCAVKATIGGRDFRFNDNDPITVTRYI